MSKVSFKVEGGKELARKLRALGADAKAILVEAGMAGADVVKDAANADAPGPHIVAKVTQRSATSVEVSIGPDRAHWYYQFVEWGASAHEITKRKAPAMVFEGDQGLVIIGGVSHPGVIAKPFLRPAIDTNQGQAVGAVMDNLRDAIDKSTE